MDEIKTFANPVSTRLGVFLGVVLTAGLGLAMCFVLLARGQELEAFLVACVGVVIAARLFWEGRHVAHTVHVSKDRIFTYNYFGGSFEASWPDISEIHEVRRNQGGGNRLLLLRLVESGSNWVTVSDRIPDFDDLKRILPAGPEAKVITGAWDKVRHLAS